MKVYLISRIEKKSFWKRGERCYIYSMGEPDEYMWGSEKAVRSAMVFNHPPHQFAFNSKEEAIAFGTAIGIRAPKARAIRFAMDKWPAFSD